MRRVGRSRGGCAATNSSYSGLSFRPPVHRITSAVIRSTPPLYIAHEGGKSTYPVRKNGSRIELQLSPEEAISNRPAEHFRAPPALGTGDRIRILLSINQTVQIILVTPLAIQRSITRAPLQKPYHSISCYHPLILSRPPSLDLLPILRIGRMPLLCPGANALRTPRHPPLLPIRLLPKRRQREASPAARTGFRLLLIGHGLPPVTPRARSRTCRDTP